MIEIAFSEGQNLTLNFDFGGQLLTFSAKNTTESGSLDAKTDAKMIAKQLKINFENVQKINFSILKMVENGQNDHVTEDKISLKSRCYGGHQKYIWTDTTHKNGIFLCKSNAETILKDLLNNFKKVKF